MATQFNIALGWRTPDKDITTIDLQGTNGIFVLGRPGTGKSHLIAHMLTQLVIKGSKLAVSEYNAHNGADGQTLLERIDHLKGAYIQPPATHGKDIVALIAWLKQELINRQNGADKYPLVVVFDEFFQFASSHKPEEKTRLKIKGNARTEEGEERTKQNAPTYWNDIAAILSDARKNNIRLILAVQESAGTGTSNMMRTVRDIFGIRLLLQSSETNADLLGVSEKQLQRAIDKMRKGIVYYNGVFSEVPYPINPTWITAVEKKVGTVEKYSAASIPETPKEYDWSTEDYHNYINALYRYGPKVNKWKLEEDSVEKERESLIRAVIVNGVNNEYIKRHIKGNSTDNAQTAKRIRNEYGL